MHIIIISYSACAGTIILCEQPILQPPTFHVCPNEIVTYTCYDRQIEAMDWIAEPYITAFDPIKYTASTAPLDLGSPPINRTNHFYASHLNITQYNMTTRSGDLTTSLTVITDGLENGTNITCQTTRTRKITSRSSSKLCYMLSTHACI